MRSGFIYKAANVFAGLGLVLFALTVIFALVLNTAPVQQRLLARVNTLLPGALSVSSLNVALFSGGLDARNVTLTDPEGRPLIECARLYVNLSLFPLLLRTVAVDEARIEGLRILLEQQGDGPWNVSRAFPEGTDQPSPQPLGLPDLSWNLTVSEFHLVRGSLSVRQSGRETLAIERLDLSAEDVNLLKQTGRLSLALESVSIGIAETTTVVQRLALDGHLKRGRLNLSTLDVAADLGTLAVRGNVEDLWAEPRLDLTLSLAVALAELDRLLGGVADMSGRPRIEATVSGAVSNPMMSLSIEGRDLTVLGRHLSSLDLKAGLDEAQVTLDRLDVSEDAGTAALSGHIDLSQALTREWPAMFTTFDLDKPAYDLHLETLAHQAGVLPGLADVMDGPLALTVDLEGEGLDYQKLRARGQIRARSESLALWDAQPADYRLTGDLTWEKQRLSVISADLESAGTRLDLTGYYHMDENTWGGQLNLAAAELSRLALIAPYARSRGVLNLDSTWEGRGADWTVKFTGTGRDLVYEGVLLGELEGQAVLDGSGMLHLPKVTLTHDGGVINARGRVGLFGDDETLDLSMTFDHLDVARLSGREEIAVRAGGRLDLAGTVSDLRAGLHLKAPGLAINGVTVGNLLADAKLAGGAVTVSDLTVSQNTSSLRAQGQVQVFEPKSWTLLDRPSGYLTLNGDHLNLADVYPGLHGTVSVDARADGALGALDGHIRLTGQGLSFAGQSLDQVAVDARFDGPDLLIDRAEVFLAEKESLQLTGRLSLEDAHYAMGLTSSDLSFGHMAPLSDLDFLAGRIRLDLAGEGRLTRPAFSGSVTLDEVSVRRKSLGSGTVQLTLADNILDLSGRFLADLTARLDLTSLAYEGEVLLDKTDLAPVCAVVGYEGLSGQLSGRITVRGQGADPSALTVEARVNSFDLNSGKNTLIASGPATFTHGPSGFNLPDTRLSLLDQGHLVLGAGGHLDGELWASAEGAVPLAVLEPFVSGVNALDGRVSLSVSLSGTRERPDLKGQVQAEGVSFVINELMQTVHDLNGLVRATPRAIVLEHLTGALDAGRFNLDGQLDLEHLKPGTMTLNIRGKALPFSLPDTLDLTVDTTMTVSGTPDQTRMEGTLMLVDGQYYRDLSINLLQIVGGRTRETAPERSATTLPYLKNMALDLSVRHRNPFLVDNNLALVELKPDLRLTGTLARPLISGRAQVGEGVITYQGNEFEVTRGVMDFLNPYRIEPTLDVECRTVIRTWILRLSVSGTPDNLKFALTSDPMESDEDVLALLLFGKTTYEMRSGGGDSSQSAARFLAEAFSRQLAENIRDATGMDTVEVAYGGGSDEAADSGVRVTIGKELSERLTVKYGLESRNAEAVQRAISEYRFFENLMINAYQDTANDFGAELVYRLEFR